MLAADRKEHWHSKDLAPARLGLATLIVLAILSRVIVGGWHHGLQYSGARDPPPGRPESWPG